jgi:hypothetical protein
MELKKKKNLEFMQGNPFATLRSYNLNKIDVDVNLKLGANCTESDYIISNLMAAEQKSFDDFVKDNPETLLPTDLDLETDIMVVDKENANSSTIISHVPSIKDETSPPLWTEVVRKGKSKSRSNKINYDDRMILQY